jgi:7-alpha-hydroxysteroid dehydrogenase
MGYRMDGKSVIVTGAANGIGLAIARRFVRAGASVVMADRDEEKLKREVKAIEGEGHDGRPIPFYGDVSEKLAMTNLMAGAIDANERIDILVNAARILVAADPLEAEDDRFEEVLAQNVTTTFRLSRLAARRMISEAETGRVDGAIVNIGSVYARRAPPALLAYSVACAAIEQLTRGLAVTVAPHGIRVNAVAIGSMPGRSVTEAFAGVEDLPRTFARATPLGRAGQPQEAAEAALFLASPGASFITGEVLTVDGGRLLRDPIEPRPDT